MPCASPPLARYRLADHVRACLVDEQVVLLDMRRNKYLGIGGPQLQNLSQYIVDWPGAGAPSPPVEDARLDPWVENLHRQHMLVSAREAGRLPTPVHEVTATLNGHAQSRRSGLEWRELVRLCWAAAVAAHWLKRRSFADIAGHVARLRRGGHPACTVEDIRGAVASYMRLRPFVLTANDQCLHDSLSLIHFLAAYGMFPTWVVGVRTRPFCAHSWVQRGSVVLNDVHENVRAYTPILVV